MSPEYAMECSRLESDVFTFMQLSSTYPGQFFLLRYEDICRDPKGYLMKWAIWQIRCLEHIRLIWK